MNKNEQKFLDFYDEYVTKIYRYVYFRVGSEQLAQDLASETFLKTWQYLKEGKPIENLSAMTYKVCRNVISDYFRNSGAFPIKLEDVSEKNNIAEINEDFLEKAENSIELEKIKNQIKLLRLEYQEIIIWRYVDDFEIEEIAQILGKSEGAVRTLISRAVSALKEISGAGRKDTTKNVG